MGTSLSLNLENRTTQLKALLMPAQNVFFFFLIYYTWSLQTKNSILSTLTTRHSEKHYFRTLRSKNIVFRTEYGKDDKLPAFGEISPETNEAQAGQKEARDQQGRQQNRNEQKLRTSEGTQPEMRSAGPRGYSGWCS